MSFSYFVLSFVAFFEAFYTFTDGIRPFTDFPSLSLFWICESTILTTIVWRMLPGPIDDDFTESEEN